MYLSGYTKKRNKWQYNLKYKKYFLDRKKKMKQSKTRWLEILGIFFEQKKEDYYKPVRVRNFWRRSYIEYGSNKNRNKTLLIEEYLNKIRPYLKDIINDLRKSDTWKIQLTIAINFVSSKDNDEERVMHSMM